MPPVLPGDEAIGLAFFDRHGALTVAAAAARIFPSDDLGPGAPEAGVVFYVDRALAGYDADLGPTYRRGIELLDRLARERADAPFHRADAAVQDAVLAALEAGAGHATEGPEGSTARAEAEAGPAAAPPAEGFGRLFFETLLTHTREGMFADPVHGGNRGMVGWRLLGHPGVQLHYRPEEHADGVRIEREPQGLTEFLRRRRA